MATRIIESIRVGLPSYSFYFLKKEKGKEGEQFAIPSNFNSGLLIADYVGLCYTYFPMLVSVIPISVHAASRREKIACD